MAMIVMILVIIGGLNLGLTGLGILLDMELNILNMLLGAWPVVEAIVYLLIGIAAVMMLITHLQKKCPMCTCDTKATPPPEVPQM